MTSHVLVASTGNICRSPLAEGIFRKKVQASGLDLKVDSAATDALQIGASSDARAVVAGRLRGYDISGHTVRQVRPSDFEDYSLILGMDQSNLADLEALRPAGNETPVQLITRFAQDSAFKNTDVPSPYFTGKFIPVIEILEDSIDGLLAEIAARRT